MSATGEVIVNGNSYDTETAETGLALMANAAPGAGPQTRQDLLRHAGVQYDGDRDVWEVLGYEDDIEAEDYRQKYERLDIARRVIELPADDTWRKRPDIYDTDGDSDFQDDINTLDQEQQLFHYLRRFDIACGIGEYGLLLIGLEDGQPLDEPPNESALNGPEDVAYFTPFAQDHVEDWVLGKDDGLEPTDERYNMPVKYQVDFGAFLEDEDTEGESEDLQWVHWKRIVHAAEGKVETDLRGTPRLKPIYNRLTDYEKVVGSSAEMFWTGAAPRFHFNTETEPGTMVPDDELENMDDEVQKFIHDMQSYIKTFNTDVEVIGGEEVDPSGVLDHLISAIAGQSGIPQRILTGSEQAELASSQDRANWFDRVRTRQHRFGEPEILRKTLNRLVNLGPISSPIDNTYDVDWSTLFELNEMEEAEAMQNRSSVALNMAPKNNTARLPGKFGEWIEFVENGEFPDSVKESEMKPPEPDPQSAGGTMSESRQAGNARISEGDKVYVDGSQAVVAGLITTNFTDHEGNDVSASDNDPAVVVATVDDGMKIVALDEIERKSWSVSVDSKESLEEQAANSIIGNAYEQMDEPHDIADFYLAFNDIPGIDDPGVGFDNWPPSWRKADEPARLIALDAWASMGGTFRGCVREVRSKMARHNAFCAAFKDEIFQTEAWRRIQT